MTRRRYVTIICEGCGHPFNPEWKSTATVEGRERIVCVSCASVLARLGLRVESPR